MLVDLFLFQQNESQPKNKKKKINDKLTASALWSTPITWNLEQKTVENKRKKRERRRRRSIADSRSPSPKNKKIKVNKTLPIRVISKANAVKFF
jgi:hypothetical protein